ncbi:NAD(P)/FAD-dependent oxidoreductase [Notoacmeibacter sp. MSK16QG-6]|uniref:NAD(P)/FAD-dependent oxidoreductase n=1 Tax=Notoacmeibacter sp. MSK16QG-6 TaxID=2957982 RepID=UPI0020A0CF8F|nr:NAD(P)/FAD-dependent oxidoreductase [Notoacmeibacter sp. MSK16QG-6]MCP1198813.1 NAD(P)/FAD-dependent oxidoreductase [Notoacmeibacter sp. MSK16QG-6]
MTHQTIILGAGAAGLHCAAYAAGQGRSTLVIDHAKAPGEKIRISGGGRCNFTNTRTAPKHFLSANPHFAKSALARYTPADFIALVERHGIAWHEKTLGQLFCDGSAKQIVAMLLEEMACAGAELWLNTAIIEVEKTETGFAVTVERDGRRQNLRCDNLVVATGGKSIPKMGATGFGYDLARQFGLPIVEPRPALVPFTLTGALHEEAKALAGVSVQGRVTAGQGGRETTFDEAILFTHRGLSGPAVLQSSSYWREGEMVRLSLAPQRDLADALLERAQAGAGKKTVETVLATMLPERLAAGICARAGVSGRLAEQGRKSLDRLNAAANDWQIVPAGTEGYRTAEVTLGGVETNALSSQTMEAKAVPGLYFIGEVVDVTGWLGGYNFQWAWASAHAAGTAIVSAAE